MMRGETVSFYRDLSPTILLKPKSMAMKSISIEAISIDDIVEKGENRYNSNNHHEVAPADYHERLHSTKTSRWINLFHDLNITPTIIIDKSQMHWLTKASTVCAQTGRFSDLFNEELEDLLFMHQKYDSFFENGQLYFVRSNNVSLKYGFYGNIRYGDLKTIIASSVSSTAQHHPILGLDEEEDFMFYLLPWQNIHSDREFRMFICDNKITAISQQHCYNMNKTLCDLDENDRTTLATRWVALLSDYFDSNIRPKVDWISEYTVDIAILDDEKVYFIEANCFGKEYAAGSSLFHWLVDEEILYGRAEENKIYFRYVVPGSIVAAQTRSIAQLEKQLDISSLNEEQDDD